MNKIIKMFLVIMIAVSVTGCVKEKTHTEDPFSATTIVLSTPYNHTIAPYGTRVYKFTANGTNTSYEFSLTNLESNCGWTLCSYDSSDRTLGNLEDNIIDPDSGDQHNDNSDEVAVLHGLEINADYYLVVDEWKNIASSYTLQITPQ